MFVCCLFLLIHSFVYILYLFLLPIFPNIINHPTVLQISLFSHSFIVFLSFICFHHPFFHFFYTVLSFLLFLFFMLVFLSLTFSIPLFFSPSPLFIFIPVGPTYCKYFNCYNLAFFLSCGFALIVFSHFHISWLTIYLNSNCCCLLLL